MTAPQRDSITDDVRDLLGLVPIDDAARDGRCQLVVGAGQFAVVWWRDDAWRFSSGAPLNFEPEAYRP